MELKKAQTVSGMRLLQLLQLLFLSNTAVYQMPYPEPLITSAEFMPESANSRKLLTRT